MGSAAAGVIEFKNVGYYTVAEMIRISGDIALLVLTGNKQLSEIMICGISADYKSGDVMSGMGIQEELTKLLKKQAIRQLEHPAEAGFLSNIFLVPKKDGGQRPVINLKALNRLVNTEHFKMEGIHMVKDLLKPGDWLAKVDLKDAYFAIPIHQTHWRYLRFQALGKTYHFTCLPFGLSSAPWVFTKTLKPVLALLREMGMRLVAYIDDILILAESKGMALDHVEALVYLLECLGFVINREKSVLVLNQTIEFLGLTVDSVNMELHLLLQKMKMIWAESRKLLKEQVTSARALARLYWAK